MNKMDRPDYIENYSDKEEIIEEEFNLNSIFEKLKQYNHTYSLVTESYQSLPNLPKTLPEIISH